VGSALMLVRNGLFSMVQRPRFALKLVMAIQQKDQAKGTGMQFPELCNAMSNI
jgi:hypothetical protein